MILTKAGERRGFHYHEEFDEYILVTGGQGVYFELLRRSEDGTPIVSNGENKSQFEIVGPGDCMFFPAGVAHTLQALTDMTMVAMLTKPWDDCDKPITPVPTTLFDKKKAA